MKTFWPAIAGLLGAQGVVAQTTTTAIPRWCGKPYESGSPNINPGGQLEPPKPSPTPLLYVQVEPRHSIYVSSEKTATFIVDAALSLYHGEPYHNSTQQLGDPEAQPFNELYFSILLESTDQVLVTNNVSVNSTDNLFDFDISALKPQLDAYNIVLTGASADGNQTFTATTKLFYLPDKTTGSVTKIDNLNGGLLFRNNATDNRFVPFLAFGFYTSYGDYLELSLDNVKKYYDLGYSAIHPVASYSPNLTVILDYFDELNLPFQYDMRGTYQNLTSVEEQVNLAKDYSTLLTWYTADEPDGNQDPLNATSLAYDTITKIDKYHPVGVVLNCQNYFFEEYSRGADFLMEDAYPIGINATWSQKWDTPCNTTYGDCGCDNCLGELQDVSNRIDDLARYQEYLGQSPKPIWAVPQSFDGEQYWDRNPTEDETWVMNQLSLNHGAKSIMMWTFPTLDHLATANSLQSKVITKSPVLDLLTGTQPQPLSIPGHQLLDVAYWIVGNQALVSIVNLDYAETSSEISIQLSFDAAAISSTPWGSVDWKLSGNALKVQGLNATATSLVILDL
ncbi:hypothetical protein PISL3812_08053 [Talaromyces islandicus]|uniref:Uncharacterized protein n=1 Tax=Talaromyces islandicus TaxID=28573 RepID=A0A0U1M641_TALIS|nr:hypothetical protein PISL3812_08053 [Talaromyces islandicus]